MGIYEELQARGLVKQVTNEPEIREMVNAGKAKFYIGFDCTADSLTAGHFMALTLMKRLQMAGNQPVALIGGGTTMIGDPSGRNATRPPLSHEQIVQNAQTYLNQAGLVLDLDRTEVRYNSEWCNKLGSVGLIQLASRYTLARLLERDDFAKRYRENTPIALHELLYPLMQGYDSVALKADVEMGGTDQTFNLLVGRTLQRQYGQEPQCILTMPLLVGLDGQVKMSKSKHNYIGITDAPNDMFGKVMSISDSLMWDWYDLLSLRGNAEIAQLKKECSEGRNPRDAKVLLAKEIVGRFHSDCAANAAEDEFNARFRAGAMPSDIPEVTVEAPAGEIGVGQMLKAAGLVSSTSDANRNIDQGGVRIEGEKVSDKGLKLKAGTVVTVQVGKRKWARITIA